MIHCTWPPAAVCPILSQLRFAANCGMSSWLAAAFSDWLGVSVMFDTSCPSRHDILKEYSVTDSESVWCLTRHVPHETIYWRNTRWLTLSQCDVWHFVSLTRRTEDSVLFPSKLNTQEFFSLLWRNTDLSWNKRRSPSIFLCFNTAISNLTRSTEKNGRKTDSYLPVSSKSARSRHYYLAKSAWSRHCHLASDHKWNERSYMDC